MAAKDPGSTPIWRSRRWPAIGLRILIFYVAVMVLVYLFQERLLYQPQTLNAAEAVSAAEARGLVYWPGPGDEARALRMDNGMKGERGSVVILHGNAGCACHRHAFCRRLEALGFEVFVHEYLGYGPREGEVSEATLAEDALETLKAVRKARPGKVYLMGISLGSGVASSVIARGGAFVDGLVLATPWDDLPSVAQSRFWFLPARWMTKDRYDSVGNIRGFKRSVAMIMAGRDRIIGNEHTRSLFESFAGKKRLFEVSAGHNGWFGRCDDAWWEELFAFLEEE